MNNQAVCTTPTQTSFSATIGNVAYRFDINGTIVPVLKFLPPVQVSECAVMHELDLHYVHQLNTSHVALGDTVTVDIDFTGTGTVALHCTPRVTDQPHYDLMPSVCPICGSPLFRNLDETHGRCINRNCSAQMPKYIRIMLAALGIVIDPSIRMVYDNLITRNSFNSPVDIFKLDANQFNADYDQVDISVLQTTLHAIRGNVGVERLILALNIPTWTHNEAIQFRLLFNHEGWRLPSIVNFFDENTLKKLPTINWQPWREFIQLPTNRQFVADLAYMLDM